MRLELQRLPWATWRSEPPPSSPSLSRYHVYLHRLLPRLEWGSSCQASFASLTSRESFLGSDHGFRGAESLPFFPHHIGTHCHQQGSGSILWFVSSSCRGSKSERTWVPQGEDSPAFLACENFRQPPPWSPIPEAWLDPQLPVILSSGLQSVALLQVQVLTIIPRTWQGLNKRWNNWPTKQ